MNEWLICWYNPLMGNWDKEFYENEYIARAALADFHARFPWNTYSLCEVKEVVLATEKWKPPIQILSQSQT